MTRLEVHLDCCCHCERYTTVEELVVPKVIRCKISLNRKYPSKIIYAAKGHPLRGEKISFLIDLRVLLQRRLKVTGYSLRRVPRSKHDNSQCSLAPDYGYKDGAQIGRHLMRIHSQKE